MPKKRTSAIEQKKSDNSSMDTEKEHIVPVVGIGASAGGLESFEEFFRRFPIKSGVACVLVPHLDPDHVSMLSEILGRVTRMPVVEVKDQMPVVPNQVFIIPPNREMTIFHNKLHLSTPEFSHNQPMKIDLFFRSLAEELGDKAIGIILSGTGTDGTLGLRAIQGGGGVSFVQDPKTAKYDGMPLSAIRSGFATFVLPVEKMPEQVLATIKNLFDDVAVSHLIASDAIRSSERGAISRILMIIRTKTGHDFTQYKKSTIYRRVTRRMAVHLIGDINIYARFLEEHPDEIKTLFRELLINVTSFFRDPEAFVTLKDEILKNLILQKSEYESIRAWVPGCATGEEAYSIAIIIREILDEMGKDCKVQIYSTDIAEDVIVIARRGYYPLNITADVSSERLKKYFIREDSGFRVKKDIREMVIFAIQNVIKDPPFTRLDLLSCRNLLIYLESDLQAKLIHAFYYALRPGGILFLSPSESIGCCPDLFKQKNRKWKIYETTGTAISTRSMMESTLSWAGEETMKDTPVPISRIHETNMAELTRRALLQEYAPPSVVTDEKGNLLYVYGDTGKYLRPAPGQVSLSVIEMAREGLEFDLRTAIHTASIQKKPVFCKNLQVRTDGGFEDVDLEIRPVTGQDNGQGFLIISFLKTGIRESGEKPVQNRRVRKKGVKPAREEELEQELYYVKENLQATIEEMQAANEELKSTNEELQSTNEELQSTNEELETSREELQSVNEELLTVNAELQAKIEQLAWMQNDMKNLLNNTNIPTIFLDTGFCIRRFTPEAVKIYKLVSSDIKRPLSDIKSTIITDDLMEDASRVLESLVPIEKEIRTADNSWYLVRINPYRTLENVIDGIVLTFTDITRRKVAEEIANLARVYAENIVDTIKDPLIILDRDLSIISANRSFYQTFQIFPSDTIGKAITQIGNHQWDDPNLIRLLKEVLLEDKFFEGVEISHSFPDGGIRRMILNGRSIQAKDGGYNLILLAIEEDPGKNSMS